MSRGDRKRLKVQTFLDTGRAISGTCLCLLVSLLVMGRAVSASAQGGQGIDRPTLDSYTLEALLELYRDVDRINRELGILNRLDFDTHEYREGFQLVPGPVPVERARIKLNESYGSNSAEADEVWKRAEAHFESGEFAVALPLYWALIAEHREALFAYRWRDVERGDGARGGAHDVVYYERYGARAIYRYQRALCEIARSRLNLPDSPEEFATRFQNSLKENRNEDLEKLVACEFQVGATSSLDFPDLSPVRYSLPVQAAWIVAGLRERLLKAKMTLVERSEQERAVLFSEEGEVKHLFTLRKRKTGGFEWTGWYVTEWELGDKIKKEPWFQSENIDVVLSELKKYLGGD